MIYSTSVTMWGSDKTTNNAERHAAQRKERQEVGQAVNCSLKAEILFHCCGICTVSTDGDGLIAPLMCVFMCGSENALGPIRLATSSSITQREEGDKCTVISVKANKIRPNLIMQPYGRQPDLTEGRWGDKCVKCVHVWGFVRVCACHPQKREPYRLKKMC